MTNQGTGSQAGQGSHSGQSNHDYTKDSLQALIEAYSMDKSNQQILGEFRRRNIDPETGQTVAA